MGNLSQNLLEGFALQPEPKYLEQPRQVREAMPIICLGPVCVPWTCIPAIVFFLWMCIKPFLPEDLAEVIERHGTKVKEACMPYLQKIPGFGKKTKAAGSCCTANGCSSPAFTPGEVLQLQSREHLASLIAQSTAEGHYIILDFGAGFCKPCQALKPKYKELAQTFARHCFVEVDAESMDDIATEYQVLGLPTFKVLAGGACIDGGTGLSETQMVQLIEKHLAGQNGSKKAQ
mmetsp:Transcript_5453/g.7605  ORF Transcript_5453/g.7605 Transcript_5453/m.7605 type:complete len:232 (+) Transcript_5453:73-768(+)